MLRSVTRSFALQADQAKYKAIKDSFVGVFRQDPIMSTILRFAWHDAGTFCNATKTGGPNGSIRHRPEMGHDSNKGLAFANSKIEAQKQLFPNVGYADLIQAGGYAAVEFCGGLPMPFRFGRVDAPEDKCTPPGRLPDATQGTRHIRDIFYRMGFNDQEIVALSGGHTIGRAYKENSGFDGPWTENSPHFDNAYFKELTRPQRPHLLRLPTDSALLTDSGLKFWVEKYAIDNHLFLEDYVKAHVKLSELGWS
jgi:L-ascorbate peroxidase